MVRHEDDQDGIHAVVAEAFCGFVADDVRHAGGHFVGLERRGEVFGLGHSSIRRAGFETLPAQSCDLQ